MNAIETKPPRDFVAEGWPRTEDLIVEDDTPVDSLFAEMQMRLLPESLNGGGWSPPDGKRFKIFADVGLFYDKTGVPVVPDVMLTMDMPPIPDVHAANHRSYFTWIVGKAPDLVIELVSDLRGGEDTRKKAIYQSIPIPYYVILDYRRVLKDKVLRAYEWKKGKYVECDPAKLRKIGLGLILWDGEYEGSRTLWLRWVDADGNLIPTTKERADREAEQGEEQARQAKAASRLAASEAKKAAAEAKRADAAEARMRELEAKLKALEGK